MSLISYAQNFEDIMLWRALKHVKCGYYIDIGAFSPDIDSVTKFFYVHQNWKGINVEPNSAQYNKFLSARPKDISLQVAISNQEGYLELNTIRDGHSNNTGLSTLDKTIAQVHIAKGYIAEIEKIKVITLANLYEKYISPYQDVHFMKIDVEGFEEKVIQGNKWDHYQPWIVLVEAVSPTDHQETTYQAWEHLLTSAGYCFVYSDQLNRFYISPKHPELRSAFNYSPNIFDEFIIYNQFLIGKTQTNKQINSLEARINSLLKSNSWKITKPLRIFSNLFQSILHCLKNLFSYRNKNLT